MAVIVNNNKMTSNRNVTVFFQKVYFCSFQALLDFLQDYPGEPASER